MEGPRHLRPDGCRPRGAASLTEGFGFWGFAGFRDLVRASERLARGTAGDAPTEHRRAPECRPSAENLDSDGTPSPTHTHVDASGALRCFHTSKPKLS